MELNQFKRKYIYSNINTNTFNIVETMFPIQEASIRTMVRFNIAQYIFY